MLWPRTSGIRYQKASPVPVNFLSIRINPACNLLNPTLRANRDLPVNSDLLCKPQDLDYTIAPEKVAMPSLDIGPTSSQAD